jgi:hypothetical protein
MIEDLKADSARWDQERRQQTARNPVQGILSRSGADGSRNTSSDSRIVQYRNSDTHQSRQYYGPTEASSGQAFADSSRDSYDGGAPRYPGTGAPGYTGASPSYQSQQYAGQGGYSGQQGYGNAPPPQFATSVPEPYAGGAPMGAGGFGQPVQPDRPYVQVGANLHARPGGDSPMYANDPYQTGSRDRVPTSSVAQGRPATYVTSGAPAPQGYTSSSSTAFYGQNPSSGSSQYPAVQPTDPFYGRGKYSRTGNAMTLPE